MFVSMSLQHDDGMVSDISAKTMGGINVIEACAITLIFTIRNNKLLIKKSIRSISSVR